MLLSSFLEIKLIRHLVKEYPSDSTAKISGYCNNGPLTTASIFDPFVFPSHFGIFSNQCPATFNECGSCSAITSMRNVPHANMLTAGIL